jgi:REP-associated tyrosine transposase
MPRKARIILPNTPHHIVQRGHNRKAVFIEASDYQIYLDTMQEWKAKNKCVPIIYAQLVGPRRYSQ